MRTRTYTNKITVKCDPAWRARVDDLARRSGISRSAVIRRAVEGTELREPREAGYRDLVVQLVKLGTLYNQTVRLAHQTRHRTGTIPTAELVETVRAHQAKLDLILRAVINRHLGNE
jgi:hypothetical protein